MLDRTFCDLLEHIIQRQLKFSSAEAVKGFWCDGVLLPTLEYEYSPKFVNDNREITLTAFVGRSGQGKYTIKLMFGNQALSRYARGLDISNCIPDFQEDGMFEINPSSKEILIQLL